MDINISRHQHEWLKFFSLLFLSIFLTACSGSPTTETEVFLQITPISAEPTIIKSPAPVLTRPPTATRQPANPPEQAHPTLTSAVSQPSATSSPTPMDFPRPTVSPSLADWLTPTAAPEVAFFWPAQGSIFGIELHAISESGGLGLLTGAGARWVRRNALLWSEVEYQPGARNWRNISRLENELLAAAESDLNTILIVRSTPPFARRVPGSACGAVAADSFEAFADFLAEAVSRYSYPPYNVLFWEIGNEPDIDPAQMRSDSVYGCWGDSTELYYGGEHYAEMLKIVYPRIKAVNPEAQVVVGGLLLDCDPTNPPETSPGAGTLKDCSSGRFLEGILEAGGSSYFDAVSFHAYDYYGEGLGRYGNLNWHSVWNTTGPVLYAKVNYLVDVLARYGLDKTPLLNTEVALICASSPRICASQDFQLTKAYYAAQVNASALAAGLQANLWYSLQGWRDSGLVGSGNAPNLAYTAYAASISRLDGAVYAGAPQLESGLMGVAYERDGTSGWIVWAVDDAAHPLTLPQTPNQVYDVFGAPLAPANPFEVGTAPVYFEWSP